MVVGPAFHGILPEAGRKASQKWWHLGCDFKEEGKFDISMRNRSTGWKAETGGFEKQMSLSMCPERQFQEALGRVERTRLGRKVGLGFEEPCPLKGRVRTCYAGDWHSRSCVLETALASGWRMDLRMGGTVIRRLLQLWKQKQWGLDLGLGC